MVKIDCPDAVLVLFEIRSHLHDVIVGPHVTEEPDEATLVELDEFLGQANFVQIFAFEEVIDEVISRNPDDMLFDEGFAIGVKVDFVGGKELFEFQSVDAGCIRFLDVKVVVVVVVLIDDADPEGPGVSESAVVNPILEKGSVEFSCPRPSARGRRFVSTLRIFPARNVDRRPSFAKGCLRFSRS